MRHSGIEGLQLAPHKRKRERERERKRPSMTQRSRSISITLCDECPPETSQIQVDDFHLQPQRWCFKILPKQGTYHKPWLYWEFSDTSKWAEKKKVFKWICVAEQKVALLDKIVMTSQIPRLTVPEPLWNPAGLTFISNQTVLLKSTKKST